MSDIAGQVVTEAGELADLSDTESSRRHGPVSDPQRGDQARAPYGAVSVEVDVDEERGQGAE